MVLLTARVDHLKRREGQGAESGRLHLWLSVTALVVLIPQALFVINVDLGGPLRYYSVFLAWLVFYAIRVYSKHPSQIQQ